jgi:hypothetical protein
MLHITSFSADRLVEIPSRFQRYFPFLNLFTTLSFAKNPMQFDDRQDGER